MSIQLREFQSLGSGRVSLIIINNNLLFDWFLVISSNIIMIFMNQRIEDFLTGCSREIKLSLSYLQIVIGYKQNKNP